MNVFYPLSLSLSFLLSLSSRLSSRTVYANDDRPHRHTDTPTHRHTQRDTHTQRYTHSEIHTQTQTYVPRSIETRRFHLKNLILLLFAFYNRSFMSRSTTT